jgi:hypothetical protein
VKVRRRGGEKLKNSETISVNRNVFRPGRGLAVLGLLSGWMLCAGVASAGTIAVGGQTGSSINDWINNTPPSDLSGFFDLGVNPFPSEPDPSQIWTSQDNIATVDYWQSLVDQIALDPSILPTLYGLGMTSTSTSGAILASSSALVFSPEPVTAALFGGGLALLGFYARRRTHRMLPPPPDAQSPGGDDRHDM